MPKVHQPSPKHDQPTPWTILLAAITTPWATPRLALLLLLPLAALVAVVALVAIYVGPVGIGAVLGTTGLGATGYGIKRAVDHRRQPEQVPGRSRSDQKDSARLRP